MNPRGFFDFFRTPSGKLLIFALVLGGGLAIYGTWRGRGRKVDLGVVAPKTNGEPQGVEVVHRPMEVFRPPPAPKPVAVVGVSTNPPPAPVPLPISLVAVNLEQERPVVPVHGEVYAPYGRLIPCETVITVDSSSIHTPIIGLVTEDIFHAGRLVIPAGTEVHGVAQVDRVRERIASAGSWTLIWQTGQELRLKGVALDREFANTTNLVGWGITDGSAGLRGSLIKADELAEVKLFAATLLSGAAKAFTEKEPTLLGAIESPSLNNAPLKGADEVLALYAKRIEETLKRDGVFIRVASGKQFYLYIQQTIDLSRATDGSGTTELAESTETP